MSNGFRSVAAQFTAVGSVAKGFWLSSAVVNGADKHTSSENQVELQTLKPDGTMDLTYTYHKGDTSRDYKAFNGWYFGKKAVKPDTDTEVLLPAGVAVWVKSTSNDFKLVIPTPFEDAE